MTIKTASEGGKPMSRPIVVVSCLAVTALLVAACFFCQTPVDRSLLTGDPCEPPCWQGLTPGESTLEDVNEFMRTSGFVRPLTEHRSALHGGSGQPVELRVSWQSDVWGAKGRNEFIIHDGVLDSIDICPDHDVTLGRLIKRYGPPEKYFANLSAYAPWYREVTLFYPTHGFTAHLTMDIEDSLQPETGIGGVWYFRAAPWERFLELASEAGYFGGMPIEGQEFGRDWQGYWPIWLE